MIDDSFTIRPYHWWLTISIAIVLHMFLLINYQQKSVHDQGHTNTDQNEIIIGLKKLKPPANLEEPNNIETVVSAPVHVEPTKPKPNVEKRKVVKPKPIIKSKPVVTKPTIASAQIAPLTTTKHQTHTQTAKNLTTADTGITSVTTENERTLYYSKLAQWLERHKKYPTIARRRNQQGDVTIQFVINKEGELLRYQLIKPSEHHSLNSATIKMLERASPMPKPPKALIGGKTELEYTIPVNFNLVK
jgi:protein TonB